MPLALPIASGGPPKSEIALGLSSSDVRGWGLLRIVFVVIGFVVLVAAFLGLLSLIRYGEFFAKVVGLIMLSGIFWIGVLLATSRLNRRSH